MVPDRSFNEFISQNNEWDRNKTEKFKLQALMKRQQEQQEEKFMPYLTERSREIVK